MNLATALRYRLARWAAKASDVAFLPTWVKTSWLDASFQRLTREGYKKNAAVNICLTRLALAYQQPRPIVKDRLGEALPNHPLQQLLLRPNPQMSWRELALITAVYKGIGGQCYLKKIRSSRGLVVELWPYHIGQMRPVPGRYTWVDGYEYSDGSSDWRPIPKADVVHLKWPIIDPDQPWMALSPLISMAREVDTDNEATRYQYALLFNDATPRTALRLPPGQRPATSQEVERMKASWRQKYGGDNRGDVAILEAGAEIVRTSLNMEELAFDTLRRVPEARISAGFLIPPEYSGLTVGLEHSTYANVSEARKGFFEDTIVQLLALDAGELEQDLGEDFGGDVTIEHDMSKVVALQENEDAKHKRAIVGWTQGLTTQNESRRMIGLADSPTGDVYKGTPAIGDAKGSTAPSSTPILGYHIEQGVVSKNEARAQLGLDPEDESQDEKLRTLQGLLTVTQAAVNVGIPLDAALALVGLRVEFSEPPPIDVTPPKQRRITKASPASSLERRMEKALSGYLAAQYQAAAEERSLDDGTAIAQLMRRFYPPTIESAFGDARLAGLDVAFDLANAHVQTVIDRLATNITGVAATTRDEVRALVAKQAEEGWSVEQLAAAIRARGEIASRSRALTISRTETGTAYNLGSLAAYRTYGVTHVDVLDGDADEPCASANGARWTLEEAEANPLAHPNCTRAFSPVVE